LPAGPASSKDDADDPAKIIKKAKLAAELKR